MVDEFLGTDTGKALFYFLLGIFIVLLVKKE